MAIILDDVQGRYPVVYEEAIVKTDSQMRTLLNLCLHAAIAVHNVSQCEKTLKYGRTNTFMLWVTDPMIQVALRMTEDDGPGAGDMTLLRTLVVNQAVLMRDPPQSQD